MGTAASAIQVLIQRAAKGYTAGPYIEHARGVCERLALQNTASTVCYWNSDRDSSLLVAESYLRLLDLIRGISADCYLSVKAPAIGFDLKLLRNILDRARQLNTFVHFDAMAPDTVDRTFALIDQARRIYSKLGCTLPGRWRRSVHDVDRAVEFGLRVRVVKGEWCGSNGDETDRYEGFGNVIERLSARIARHVAVATHDGKLAVSAIDQLKKTGTSCELELLYGLPLPRMLKIARNYGITARIYVPYGHAGLPYRLKDAAHRPRILGWFVRDLIGAQPPHKSTFHPSSGFHRLKL
jgi:proline dehydrogenase